MRFDLIISGGTCVLPWGELATDIGVRDGRVASLSVTTADEAGEVIEAGGLHVLPGLIDPHVHLRDPGVEGARLGREPAFQRLAVAAHPAGALRRLGKPGDDRGRARGIVPDDAADADVTEHIGDRDRPSEPLRSSRASRPRRSASCSAPCCTSSGTSWESIAQ